jgi:hypothetical protein
LQWEYFVRLLEILTPKQKAKYERGLKKSRSLRSVKDKQFSTDKTPLPAFEVQG